MKERPYAKTAKKIGRVSLDAARRFEGFPPASLEQFYRFFEKTCEDILRSVGIDVSVQVGPKPCGCGISPDDDVWMTCRKYTPKSGDRGEPWDKFGSNG